MIPLNLWEHQNAIKTLYADCVEEVCARHGITRMELDILLFLANNPCFDTATDIVEIRYLAKSQVSASVKQLERRGFLRKEYTDGNKKTAHLKICAVAADIIQDGRAAQQKFFDVMHKGLTQEEIDSIRRYYARILTNIDTYLKHETGGNHV